MAQQPESPTSSKKTLKELVNETPFQIIFQGTPQAQTTSVSSADLAAASGPATKMYDVTLATIRKHGKLSTAFLFCINDTNVVADTTSLGYYVSLTKDNITALRDAAADTSNSAVLTGQYTSRHRRPDQIPQPPTLPGLAGKDDYSTGASIGSKTPVAVNIDTSGFAAGSGNIQCTHAVEMTEKQWNYVMVTNSLLHGLYLNKSFALQKAREPAFKLKNSFPDLLQSPVGTAIDSKATGDGLFCIPPFEVNDASSVTITQVKSTVQLSMAQHGFSSWRVEASASGGFDGISGGASAGAGSSSSNSSASDQGKTMDCLHASYNFPRVKVFLDPDNLELSDGCRALLEKIRRDRNFHDVDRFYRKYGHVFTCAVTLGGRLHATRDSSAFTANTVDAKKDQLNVEVGLNFSAPFVSGSASASYAKNNSSQSTNTNSNSSESLTWEAQGGDTLLGSKPPAWVTTVGSFYNWRVIGRSDGRNILGLLNYISKEDWSKIFHSVPLVTNADAVGQPKAPDGVNYFHRDRNIPSSRAATPAEVVLPVGAGLSAGVAAVSAGVAAGVAAGVVGVAAGAAGFLADIPDAALLCVGL